MRLPSNPMSRANPTVRAIVRPTTPAEAPETATLLASATSTQAVMSSVAAAASDDITAWVLVALASSVAVSGASAGVVGRTIALTVGFALLMGLLGRRILERAAVSYDEAGSIS